MRAPRFYRTRCYLCHTTERSCNGSVWTRYQLTGWEVTWRFCPDCFAYVRQLLELVRMDRGRA